MRSYYDAHMDLVAPLPVFNLYNNQWPIYTSYGPQPPAKLVEGDGGEPVTTFNSILSPGVVVTGGAVSKSVLSPACCVETGAEVSDSVLLSGRARRRGRGRAQRDHRQERDRPARAPRSASSRGGRPRARLRGRRRADRAGQGPGGPAAADKSGAPTTTGPARRPSPSDLVDVAAPGHRLLHGVPDPEDVDQQVAFGTSGHRGSSLKTSFNETHILATTQAICDYRREQGYDGPLFIGRDTHGLSEPAWATALEVLVANDVTVLVDDRDGYTPTPAVSHAILRANRGRTSSGRPGRRHRGHPLAQPADRRRLQVQPAARRPGRLRRHER